MLEMTRTDPEWKDKIITGDETRVYGYDPETKRQSAEWRGQGFHRRVKAKTSLQDDDAPIDDTKAALHAARKKTQRLATGSHRRVKAKTSLQDDNAPIDNTKAALHAARKKEAKRWRLSDWLTNHDRSGKIYSGIYRDEELMQGSRRTKLRGVLQAICCLKRLDCCLPPMPVYFLEDSRRFYELLSYLGPKQRLSVVQNVLRRPRRCERRRACWTPEHFNNRRKKINEVEKMILANRRITVREVAEDLNISIGSCHSIFINDLGMRRVAAKFVPKLLNCDQKQHRMNIANEMLDSVRDDPNLIQRVITGDEAWVYGYDVETKAQSSQWKLPHEPRPKKARQVRSNVKVLLTVFFDCRGVVHHEFLPQGKTVNKEYYLQVMRNLREAIRQKRPDLWKNKNWLLHHDNAPAHTSLLVRDFLAKNNTLMMPQPPYSPDLAPCDFFLFPKLKRPMKGRRYATLDEIKTASKEELKKIFFNDFLKCFEDWKNRWHKAPKDVREPPLKWITFPLAVSLGLTIVNIAARLYDDLSSYAQVQRPWILCQGRISWQECGFMRSQFGTSPERHLRVVMVTSLFTARHVRLQSAHIKRDIIM
ncbi:hypothetical protein LAZ67_10000554 [Cordylochernes scorpioides]|uniref:Transposase n=1 Tax=Cordylochernes scorpioides TaxID=51811 RepID=A0ABY6KV70_9ARAC|nr:hypothetical protein LAZ67_10000554 [Cordylochernes scorpioides]